MWPKDLTYFLALLRVAGVNGDSWDVEALHRKKVDPVQCGCWCLVWHAALLSQNEAVTVSEAALSLPGRDPED